MTGRPLLAPSELLTLTAAASGWSQRETAHRLGIPRGTVRARLGSAQRKLQAASLAHAVALAIRAGLIDLDAIPSNATIHATED